MMKTTLPPFLIAMFCAPHPGCVAADGDAEGDEDFGSATAPLNGIAKYPDGSCSSSERTRIEELLSRADNIINGTEYGSMLSCLREATFSMEDGSTPEVILDELGENMPTKFRCADLASGVVAQAYVGISDEELTWDHGYLASLSVAQLAGTLLHEVAHNKGYRHPSLGAFVPSEYQHTVPEQVERCAQSIVQGMTVDLGRGPVPVPNGGMRSQETNRVALAPAGEFGGTDFGVLTCGHAKLASGLAVRTNDSLQALGLRCLDSNGYGILQATATVGDNNAGTASVLDCPLGSLVVGVRGRAGADIDAIAPVCATASNVWASSPTVSRSITPRGGSGGTAFERLCPIGMAVKAVQGRAGDNVDRLTLVCHYYGNHRPYSARYMTEVGTNSGTRYEEHCPTGVMTSLTGVADSEVRRLGGRCRAVDVDASGNILLVNPSGLAVPGRGSRTVTGHWASDQCPSGSALVGVNYRAGSRLDQVQGICANVTGWAAGTTTITTTLAQHGGTGGTAGTIMCPNRYFLSGWKITATSGSVTRLNPLCFYKGL